MRLIDFAEKKILPDPLVRLGIRQLLKKRLQDEMAYDPEQASLRKHACIEMLRSSPIAIETDAANEQHYEVPAAFYQRVLGKHLKYSGCFWNRDCLTLNDAERTMLDLYLQRADL